MHALVIQINVRVYVHSNVSMHALGFLLLVKKRSSQSMYLGVQITCTTLIVVSGEGSSDNCALGEREGERCPAKHPDSPSNWCAPCK